MGTTVKSDSIIKQTLKNICCNDGWCYGILWGFDQTNSLLLTLKDVYCEEQMEALIHNMLLQVHVLGRGAIGQAALTGDQQWIFSDSHHATQNTLVTFESFEVFQDDLEFYCQFSIGIETIALISVEPWGVVQLGSTQKIPQRNELADQVKEIFSTMSRSLKIELPNDKHFSDVQFEPITQFVPFPYCDISHPVNQNFQDYAEYEDMKGSPYSTSDHYSTNSLFTSSFLTENQFQSYSKPTNQLEQLLFESGNLLDCSVTQVHSNNSDCSVVTSSWPHIAPALKEDLPLSKPSSSQNSSMNYNQENLVSTSFQAHQSCNNMNTQSSTLLSVPTIFESQTTSGLFSLDDLPKFGAKDDHSLWFSPMPGSTSTSFTSLLRNGLPYANEVISRSNLSGVHKSPVNISNNVPADSIQSSVTYAFKSNDDDKCSGVNNLYDGSGVQLGCERRQCWNGSLVPVANGNNLDFSTNESECISEKCMGSKAGTSNSLFSQLGLDQILDGMASSPCSFSAKRRKVDSSFWNHNQVNIQGLPHSDEKMNLVNPVYSSDKMNTTELNCEVSMKEPGNTGSPKRQEEPVKTGKKKARPGTKPRPKDRQMIQDRLAELRELIPNGEKMTIDRLLERTIRHLNFMHDLKKHAENLKQIDTPKIAATQKELSSSGGGGVTWACEVGDQNMICPLIVEDLSTPGQMLIDILCEPHGFFLEIWNIIRGFGLVILKGVMEVREAKIWGHFIVEAEGHRHVTRHEIFSSLIQLLQMTSQSTTNANVSSSSEALFTNRQPAVSFPVNMAETLKCGSL